MRACWRFVVGFLVWGVAVAWWSFTSVGVAQQVRAGYDEHGNRTLAVDGWRFTLPRMYRDSNSGELWLDWQYPDGTGRGFGSPLDAHLRMRGFEVGTTHDPRDLAVWFAEGEVEAGGNRSSSWHLPGYDLEYTQALIEWWEQGNDGCFDLEEGEWVQVDCVAAPPDDAGVNDVELPACPEGMNPFEAAGANCRIIPEGMTGSGPVPQDVQEAFEAYREAKERCELNPTSENCAAYERAYQVWIDLMQRGP